MKIVLLSLLLAYLLVPTAHSWWRGETSGRMWSFEHARYVHRGQPEFGAALLHRKLLMVALPLFFGGLLLHGQSGQLQSRA